MASRYGSPNPSYVLGAAQTHARRYSAARSLSGTPVTYVTPGCDGPCGPTNVNSASGYAGRITRSKMSSRNPPRLRPSTAPTNTIEGCGDLPIGQRLKDCRVDAVRDDPPHERIVALRVGADADDGRRRQEGGQQFLKVHTPLQDRAADRRRVQRLAARAAVHDAHDRLAAHREQQAVAVRDDDIELAQIDLQRENDCRDIRPSCGGRPRSPRTTSTAARELRRRRPPAWDRVRTRRPCGRAARDRRQARAPRARCRRASRRRSEACS